MANEGIELEIYPYNDVLGKPKILPGRKTPRVLSEMKGIGGGSFFVSKSEPRLTTDTTLLDSRNVCKIKSDGQYIGAFLIDRARSVIETTNGQSELGYEVTGPGLKAWFDDADVYPAGGLYQLSGSQRYFNFSSEVGSWYNPAQWTNPYVFATVKQTPIWGYTLPNDWPSAAPHAKWIWASPYADPMNPKPCYFRWTINITTPGLHAIYTAVDDKYILYVDGQQVAKSSDKAVSWTQASRIEVNLSEGPHVISYMARNNGDQDYNGPAALLAALFRVNGTNAETIIGVSDVAGWKCMAYPTAPPSWTVGEILLKLLSEAEARGVLFPTYLDPSFTATLDSYGQPWTPGPEWSFGVGESYSSVISKLGELYDIWIDPDGFQLHVVPTRGTNRTVYTENAGVVTSTPVKFMLGKDITEASTESRGKIKNALGLKTVDGWLKAEQTASIAKYGRIEGTLDTGTTPELAKTLADLVFAQRATEEEGASYRLIILDKVPYQDFDIGDWVLAPNKRGETVPRRVMSISTEESSAGKPIYTIEFDTIFKSNEEKLARITEKLGGGGPGSGLANNAGSTPGIGMPIVLPPSPVPAILRSKAPTLLTADSVGSWNATGVTPISTVTLNWAPVTQYTDDSPVVVLNYEVWARYTSNPDSGWDMIGVTTTNSYTVGPFNPTDIWSFRVRAVTTDGIRSDWSPTVNETMEGPNVALPAPNPPTLQSTKGVLLVTWNGQLNNLPPAPQFRYVFAEVAPSEFGTYTRMGPTLNREGRQITITGLEIGEDWWVRLRAVDGMNLISTPSVSVSHIVTGIDLGDLDEAVTDAIEAAAAAAEAAQGTANAAQIAAGLAQDDVDAVELDVDALALEVADVLATAEDALSTASGMITWSPNAPTLANGTGKPLNATWYRTSANGIIGQWRWTGSAWVSSPIDSDAIFSINAVKITAGTLDAARIAVNSISANKLLVGNMANLIPDPNFDNPTVSGWLSTASLTYMPNGGRTANTHAMRITAAGAQKGAYNLTNIPVQAGDIYYLSMWVKSTIALPAVSNLLSPYFQVDRVGTTMGTIGLNNALAIPADTWTKITGTMTIPADGYRVRAGIYIQAAVPSGALVDFTEPEMIRVSGSTLIADGAITTDKIFALAITAAKIAAGTITGDKVAAGTISTQKLMITSLENLIDDGGFEYHTTATPSWTLNAGASIATVNNRTGLKSLLVTGGVKVAATTVSAFQVEEGESYRLGGWVRLLSGVMNATAGIVLRLTYGASESSTATISADIATSRDTITTAYGPIDGVWVVPAGAKFARVQVVQRDTDGAKSYHIDDLSVFKMGTGELIVDGSITTPKIGANQIIGQHIQADTIDGDKIRSDSVDTRHVRARSIIGEKIESDTIDTNHLKAGIVKTQHISPEVGGQLDITANDTVQIIAGQIAGVEEQANGTQGDLETMQTYYAFGPTGAVISSPGSVFATAVRNDRIEMLENGNVVSYWNSGTMYVNQLVGERVTLGNHQLEKYEDGTVVRAL